MLSRRTLRAMRDSWRKDLDRLEAAYVAADASTMETFSDAEHETVRNLATAIAEIDGLISMARPTDKAHPPRTNMAPSPADQIIGQIEELFPNWRAYRDLVDCITCELHELRKRAEGFAE